MKFYLPNWHDIAIALMFVGTAGLAHYWGTDPGSLISVCVMALGIAIDSKRKV
jgi:hypothetical protein